MRRRAIRLLGITLIVTVAAAVDGFAGYFLEADVPTVYLTDTSQRPATRSTS